MLLFLLSCSTSIISSSGLEKIEKLDDIATFLTLLSDGENDIAQNCGLTSNEALAMMQPLHALIDEEIQNGKNRIINKHLINCEINCHCGVYSDIASNSQLKQSLYIKASTISHNQLVTCANKTSTWICKDSLLNSLRKEVSPAADAR